MRSLIIAISEKGDVGKSTFVKQCASHIRPESAVSIIAEASNIASLPIGVRGRHIVITDVGQLPKLIDEINMHDDKDYVVEIGASMMIALVRFLIEARILMSLATMIFVPASATRGSITDTCSVIEKLINRDMFRVDPEKIMVGVLKAPRGTLSKSITAEAGAHIAELAAAVASLGASMAKTVIPEYEIVAQTQFQDVTLKELASKPKIQTSYRTPHVERLEIEEENGRIELASRANDHYRALLKEVGNHMEKITEGYVKSPFVLWSEPPGRVPAVNLISSEIIMPKKPNDHLNAATPTAQRDFASELGDPPPPEDWMAPELTRSITQEYVNGFAEGEGVKDLIEHLPEALQPDAVEHIVLGSPDTAEGQQRRKDLAFIARTIQEVAQMLHDALRTMQEAPETSRKLTSLLESIEVRGVTISRDAQKADGHFSKEEADSLRYIVLYVRSIIKGLNHAGKVNGQNTEAMARKLQSIEAGLAGVGKAHEQSAENVKAQISAGLASIKRENTKQIQLIQEANRKAAVENRFLAAYTALGLAAFAAIAQWTPSAMLAIVAGFVALGYVHAFGLEVPVWVSALWKGRPRWMR